MATESKKVLLEKNLHLNNLVRSQQASIEARDIELRKTEARLRTTEFQLTSTIRHQDTIIDNLQSTVQHLIKKQPATTGAVLASAMTNQERR